MLNNEDEAITAGYYWSMMGHAEAKQKKDVKMVLQKMFKTV